MRVRIHVVVVEVTVDKVYIVAYIQIKIEPLSTVYRQPVPLVVSKRNDDLVGL